MGYTPSFSEQSKQLTEARQHSWLGTGSRPIQEQALRNFQKAKTDWILGRKGRPRFKNKKSSGGFCVPVPRVKKLNKNWATLCIPYAGRVRFKLSKPCLKVGGMAHIHLDSSGRWHVSLCETQLAVGSKTTNQSVGLDFGIKNAITDSNGNLYNIPQLAEAQKCRIKRLQRRMAQQAKGSRRREKTRLQIAKILAYKTDMKNDRIEKITTSLVKDFDLIAIENFKIRNLVKTAKGTVDTPGRNTKAKSALNQAILDQGWGLIRKRLMEKSAANGGMVVKVNSQYTSQMCNRCKFISKENRKNQATFICKQCGNKTNADINAARNILAAGQAVTGRGGYPAVMGSDEPSTQPTYSVGNLVSNS